MFRPKNSARATVPLRAFTLMELVTVVLIIAILSVIAYGVLSNLRHRAKRVQCAENLRQLYVASEVYVQQNEHWPQIKRVDYPEDADYANAWIDVLTPYSVPRAIWICPSIEELLDNPDYSDRANARIDYIPMPFDEKPTTPHEWSTQPWFVENGDVHGNGNLIVFTDGHIGDLSSVVH